MTRSCQAFAADALPGGNDPGGFRTGGFHRTVGSAGPQAPAIVILQEIFGVTQELQDLALC